LREGDLLLQPSKKEYDPDEKMPQTIPARSSTDPRPALALLYAAKFGHLGIVIPFLAPWLQLRGLGPAAIGVMLALGPFFKILAPWMWGRWADRSGRRRDLLVLSAFSAAAALAAMVWFKGLAPLAMLMLLYGFTRAPILPYVEATVLEQSELRNFGYGPIRLWGSLGFVLCSSGVGLLQGRLSLDASLLIAAGLLTLCAVVSMALPLALWQPERPAQPPARKAGGLLFNRLGVVRFFAACALMQASHGAYYTFYSIRLQDLGHGGATIGALWALAVVCEVLLLTRMDALLRRVGTELVLRCSLVVAAVRWTLIGSVSSLGWLALGQTLHAITYAAFHVAAISVVFRLFSHGRQARGQAMYSGMTFGLGLFVGSLAAGWVVAWIGLPALFQGSAGVALLAVLVLGRSASR
jgi:PPP family 3-phenylpropionic acid transporter